MTKAVKPDAEQPYFDAPAHIPGGSDHQIPHSHRLVYRDYDVIVHLTGYEYETFGETLWAVGAEVVKELEIVVPVSLDQTQHYRSYDEALAHGTALGKRLVDGL
ncbi:hypothetical protein [Stutzerimonas zhaodongensis]|jgi:hypothetical protein|uniref:Uncharacterized protein n=1 Tax=Stutzerimonas zhaodongensis TaxID=1176257 RepID=A0A365PT16_9GAMM|nr:hypothetical protein [Stutzerimonas zhaodongensis]QWV15744.1 hypothetical protein KQ248_14465 [Stutzerimonas zhaodongensis]RBA56667.1 hypothetical protein DQ403_14420 [Stutzerimonas zhaodongensis]